MNEIHDNELNEIRAHQETGFLDIKPETDMDISTAREFWDGVFSGAESMIGGGEAEREMLDVEQHDPVDQADIRPRYYHTLNESLENDRHAITGVPFEKKIIELPSGDVIEGVFASFESEFETSLPEDMFTLKDRVQFKECNRSLFEEIEKNPDLRSRFSEEQIEQIRDGISDGTAPDGYVWHHDAEPGRMQLVDFYTHSYTGHTGGRALWGGGTEAR